MGKSKRTYTKQNKKTRVIKCDQIKKPKNVLEDYNPTKSVAFFDSLYSFRERKPMPVPKKDLFGRCSSIVEFEIINKVGKNVYKAIHHCKSLNYSKELVALKKSFIENQNEGLSSNVIRVISLLLKCNHENIVHLLEVVMDYNLKDIFLSMEYCKYNLSSVLENESSALTESHVKCIFLQLLKGLKYLHSNFIIHQNIKVSNLLITNKGCIKITGFGLARFYDGSSKKMITKVVIPWYKAPEILLGSSMLTTAIDMWASGCVLAELLLHKPLLPGRTEIHQFDLICQLLGNPSTSVWLEMNLITTLKPSILKQQKYDNIKSKISWLSDTGIYLLSSLLEYKPSKRATAKECLKSLYFVKSPKPCDPKLLSPLLRKPNFRTTLPSIKPEIGETIPLFIPSVNTLIN